MSYFDSKKMREERKGLVEDMQAISRKVKEEARVMSPEEMERYDNLDKAQKELSEKVESAERVERVDSLIVSTPHSVAPVSRVVTRQDHENAFRAWAFRAGGNDALIRSEHLDGAEKCGINLNSNSIKVKLMRNAPENLAQITRTTADSVTNASYGEPTLVGGVEAALLTYGSLRQAATVLRTSNGNNIVWCTANDTANDGAARDKNDPIANTAYVLGKVTLSAFSYGSGVYPVSNETLQDSGIDLSGLIGSQLGERIARVENAQHTNGVGTITPTGINTSITDSYTWANTTGRDWYNVLANMKMGVDAAYRSGPKCGYMFSDSVLSELLGLVDDYGRPLWVSSLSAGEPNTILGRPYWINNDMGDWNSTSVNAVLFGDFSKFLIRDINQVTVSVLREIYSVENATAFVAHHRTDSACINTSAFVAGHATSGSPSVG